MAAGLVLLWFGSTPSAHAAEAQGKQNPMENELNDLVQGSVRQDSFKPMKSAVDSLTKNTQAATTSAQAELESAGAELNREVTTTVDATNTALTPVAEPVEDAVTPALTPLENTLEPAATPLDNVHHTVDGMTQQGSSATDADSNATAPAAPAVAVATSTPTDAGATRRAQADGNTAVENVPSQSPKGAEHGRTEPAPAGTPGAPVPVPAPLNPLVPMIPASGAGFGSGSPSGGGANGQRGAPADAALVVPIFVLGGLSSTRFVRPATSTIPAGPTSEPDVSPD